MKDTTQEKTLPVGEHKRTITQRPVTYICEWCGQESTELRYPGPTPRYHPECKPEAQASLNRNRVKHHRERQAAEADPWAKRPRGRPRGS